MFRFKPAGEDTTLLSDEKPIVEEEEYKISFQHLKKERSTREMCMDLTVYSFRFWGMVAIVIWGLALLANASVWLYYVNSTSNPNYVDLHLEGIQSPNGVRVRREANGLIHISADTDSDLFFAQGVVTAQERLFQMEIQRRALMGRLSEMVGSGGIGTGEHFATHFFLKLFTFFFFLKR